MSEVDDIRVYNNYRVKTEAQVKGMPMDSRS